MYAHAQYYLLQDIHQAVSKRTQREHKTVAPNDVVGEVPNNDLAAVGDVENKFDPGVVAKGFWPNENVGAAVVAAGVVPKKLVLAAGVPKFIIEALRRTNTTICGQI